MFKLDNTLLEELGLGTLPPEEKNRMLAHIYETLEMRVGMKLAEQMSNEQLDEFEGFIDRNDEAGALKWLETNFPDYKGVVASELENLKKEIKAAAPQIVAASVAAAAQAGAGIQPGQAQQMAAAQQAPQMQPGQPQYGPAPQAQPQYQPQQPAQPQYPQPPQMPYNPGQQGQDPYQQQPPQAA